MTRIMRIAHGAAACAWLAGLAAALPIPASAAPVQAHAGDKQAEKQADKQADNLIDPNAEPVQAAAKPAVLGADVDLRLTAQGQGMYKAYCQKCHGLQMVTSGGAIFDLRGFPLDDKARFLHSVANGKRAMPAWGGVFNADEIEALWSYVASYQLSRMPRASAGVTP